MISKFQVRLKFLLPQGLSEPEFYCDLVYKFGKKSAGTKTFSAQLIKMISHRKHVGYVIDILRQTAWLVVNPIKIDNFACLFYCTPAGQTSDSMTVLKVRPQTP